MKLPKLRYIIIFLVGILFAVPTYLIINAQGDNNQSNSNSIAEEIVESTNETTSENLINNNDSETDNSVQQTIDEALSGNTELHVKEALNDISLSTMKALRESLSNKENLTSEEKEILSQIDTDYTIQTHHITTFIIATILGAGGAIYAHIKEEYYALIPMIISLFLIAYLIVVIPPLWPL